MTIGNSVTEIEDNTFYGCSNLTSITIPYSVTSIGSSAFSDCSNLTSITIPYSVTSIGSSAFSGCSKLTSVAIPNSVTYFGDSAFSGCSSLTSVTIGNSVTWIGENAFMGCSGLTSVIIPNSVTRIGKNAFNGCYSLTSVNYEGTATEWTAINMDSGNEALTSAEVTLFVNPIIADGSCGGYVSWVLREDGTLTISGTGAMGDYELFYTPWSYYSNSIKKVIIHEGVSTIGKNAFTKCSNLIIVEIPSSVTIIDDGAFRDCSSLTSVTIGNSVTSIGNYAFYGCSSLTSVTIGNSVTSIEDYAFYNCSRLSSISIPNSVVRIGDSAFSGCSSLTLVDIQDINKWLSISGLFNLTYYGTFDKTLSLNGEPLNEIAIPEGMTLIPDNAFRTFSNITSVTIPNSVTSIGEWAFDGCSSLTSVTIPNSVTSIGVWAFSGCSSLTSVTIPNSVTSIEYSAFEDCSSLTTVNYGGTKAEWEAITIDYSNDPLLNANITFTSSQGEWTVPIPATYQEVATDGTEQYLYGGGGFFCGGNDWGIRASVGTSADPIRFTVYDGENYNFGCYPASKGNWLYVSCNNYDSMWVDAGNADSNASYPGTDSWQLSKNVNGSYTISNIFYEGTLGVAEIYRGLKGNTRVYINDPLDQYEVNDEYVPSITGKFYNEWYFIDQAEYEALKPQVEVYLAAVGLEGAISRVKAQDESYDLSVLNAVHNNTSSTTEELNAAIAIADAAIEFSKAIDVAQKSYTLDFSAPIAVYNNPASTAEELAAAKNQIQEIINSYLTSQTTFDTPIDFTSTIGDGSDVGPWQREFTGEGMVGIWHTNTWSTEANNGGDGTDMITPFCEDWVANGSLLSDQKIFQVLAGAAPGLYKFSANVRLYNEKGDQEALTGCTMYFGDERVTLDEQVNMYKSGSKCVLWKDGGFQIIAILKEAADIEFGFDIKDPTFNWMAFKETSLKYYGNEDVEANALLLTKGDKVYKPFEGTNASVASIEAYNEAVEKFNSAQTAEEIKEAVTAISTAKTALEASQKAYNTYIAKIDEIRDYFANNELFGDKSDIVADYIMEGTEDEPDEVNPCGSADYIIINHELTDEQIAEETTRIDDLFKKAIAESLYEGMDCTPLLTNADFRAGDSTGWTVNVNPTYFAWTGGLLNVPVCESWHSLFDISQEVSAPDGIYAISLNGFCRLDDGVDSEVPAEVYINNFSSKLQNLNAAPIPADEAIDGFNAYLSNGASGAWTTNPIFQDKDGNPCKRQSPADNTDSVVDGGYVPNGLEGASVAFSAGRYQAVAYGLCKGGKLIVGVRNRVSTHVWAVWGNFKLTYCGPASNLEMNEIANGNCGKKLIWILSEDGTLTISGSGDMENYSYNNLAPWYQYKEQITSVEINKGVTNIASYAFYGCSNLTSISSHALEVPSTGNYAFKNVPSTCKVYVPMSAYTDYKNATEWKMLNIMGVENGDVNLSGTVNITDAVEVVNNVLGEPSEKFAKEWSDVNGDNQYTIADASAVINVILGEEIGTVDAKSRTAQMDADALTLCRTNTNQLTLRMNNTTGYNAFQFDVVLPEDMAIENVVLNQKRCADFNVMFRETSAGHYTVAVFNFDNVAFATGTGSLLNIITSGNGNEEDIVISNIHFATTKATDIMFEDLMVGEATDINNIDIANGTDGSTNIYDLNGRKLLTAKYGVNIINGKKVVKN